MGKDLIDYVCGNKQGNQLDNLCIKNEPGKGILFVGKSCEKTFLLFDLTQCNILGEKKSPESLLLILQKVFRTAIRIWNHQPFTSSERVHGTKSIVFPFVFTDHRRVVIERAPKCERLTRRGIDRPLLVYKYGTEDAPRGEEIADTSVLRDGGETYLSQIPIFQRFFQDLDSRQSDFQPIDKPLLHTTVNKHVSDGGFMYLNYEQQLSKLTLKQRSVVENTNVVSPIRIDGPAGTGKTASMILRAYFLLKNARAKAEPFSIVFFAHSESTKCEIESAFSLLENADSFLSEIFSILMNSMYFIILPKVLNKNRFPFVLPWTMVKRLVIEEIQIVIISKRHLVKLSAMIIKPYSDAHNKLQIFVQQYLLPVHSCSKMTIEILMILPQVDLLNRRKPYVIFLAFICIAMKRK